MTRSITVGVVLALAGLGMAQNKSASPIREAPVQTNQETATPLQPPSPQANFDRLSAAVDRLTAEVTAWREQESQKTKSNEPPSWPAISSTMVAAIATVFIALLGFFQYRVLHRQRLAMDKQAEYMRDALELNRLGTEASAKSAQAAILSANLAKYSIEVLERADVIPEKINAQTPAEVMAITPDTILSVVLRNHGRTHAENVATAVWVNVTGDEPRLSSISQPKIPVFTIPPGGQSEVLLGKTVRFVDWHHFAKLETHEAELVVVVRVTYRDIFGKERWAKVGGAFEPRFGWAVHEYESGEGTPSE